MSQAGDGRAPPRAAPDPAVAADQRAAAFLLAVDPVGLGGAVLRAGPGPERDGWLALLRAALPLGGAWRRMPASVPDSRLLGGLDLTATLAAGRPVAERGVLAEADGGVLLLAMAERAAPGMAARIAAVMDAHEVALERDGIARRLPARFGLVALDEGIEDEGVAQPLCDRLAFHIVPLPPGAPDALPDMVAARARLNAVQVPDEVTEALCGAAVALGIASLRAPMLAQRAAIAAAALAGRDTVAPEDAALAARLVLAPRATRLPEAPPAEEPPPPEQGEARDAPKGEATDAPLEDRVLDAARAVLPEGLLAGLGAGLRDAARRSSPDGRAGSRHATPLRGRPAGTRQGEWRAGARLALVETLRAAAPWQPIRRRGRTGGPRLLVKREDIRLRRFEAPQETTAIFVVDASGSAAMHRLSEAKGAVELLLADCYVRRDKVALIGFRGRGADVLLPPTASLVRAKRSLAGLPGGGGTPLAAGLDTARGMAEACRRAGRTPLLVLLTDGRANVARDGTGGRAQAEADALDAAKPLRIAGVPALLVDTAPRPQAFARDLAAAMGARYLPLPMADAARLSGAVRDAAA
ncbi:magnesium chelatase subunit D [Roseomonas fluvialis]|uniref:Mg-protoporphyrin IX chelatase n=1 Tax=Roseomonas fluvialis TaxID=1750527 RepID=A0ABN6P135_9PROT|nr:magnesium chelatase subunit D [Roseomonas fluvialis]BDG72284.1 Mg-protoporphyrin IX chelatase [Roseomonas fluvialis]